MKQLLNHNIRSLLIVILLFLTGGYAAAFSSEADEEKAVIVYVDATTTDLVVTNPVKTAYEIQLFDLTGKEVVRVVQEPETPTCRIQTSQLCKGIYLVRVTPAPNVPSVTLKVMIR
jgi:hypothetical protein